MYKNSPFSLEGKTILVTGASSGIGKATAIECSKMGANVVITGRNKERLQETFLELEGEHNQQIIADIKDNLGIEELLKDMPSIQGVVHSAGIAEPIPFQFTSEEKLSKIFSINFFAPVLLSKELLKKKLLEKNSSIVFVSSISGPVCSYVGGGIYGATKGAIHGIAKGMAIDLAPKRIRVNTIQPGMIDTAILNDGSISEEQLLEDMKKYPLKRYGKPEEVAFAIIYLLSDAAMWVTGTNLLIDGGYTLL